jgi:hypothetical protein
MSVDEGGKSTLCPGHIPTDCVYETIEQMPKWLNSKINAVIPAQAVYLGGRLEQRHHPRHYGIRVDTYLTFQYELAGVVYKTSIRAEKPRNLHKIRPY